MCLSVFCLSDYNVNVRVKPTGMGVSVPKSEPMPHSHHQFELRSLLRSAKAIDALHLCPGKVLSIKTVIAFHIDISPL